MLAATDEQEISDFVRKFSNALRRSKRIPNTYKTRLRKLQAMDSLLRVRKINEGIVTSNDYRELLLATIGDPSIPKEVRQRMKDLAVQILSPDDEIVDFRDKEMEQLLNRILSGNVSYDALFDMYANGTLDRVMEYIEKMLDRAEDGEGGYDEKLLELLNRRRNTSGPMRIWGPDRLIQLDFVYRNFAKYFGKEDSHDVVRKRVLNKLSSLGRSLEKRKTQQHGSEESLVKKIFSPGDEIDSVDFEDTMENIVNSAHGRAGIAPDDIIVREETGELVTAILIQDVSRSMFQYFSSIIPCFVMTYSALKQAKKGVCIFAGNAYPIKSLLEDMDDEKAVNTYYNMINASLNDEISMGSMGTATFRWAEEELEKAGVGRKMVFLFSDCGFNEFGSPLEIVRRLNERGAEVVVAHPDVERGFFGWGPFGGPNLVHQFEKCGCKVLDCSGFNRFVTQLEEVL
jgi:uncharacterized protein with von Willebrand factor type A (vWA) domain